MAKRKVPGKRASGGARATAKKKRERKAARKRAAGGDAGVAWLDQVKALGALPKKSEKAHSWLGRAALLLVQATLRDTAIPPEQMRRDAMKQIEQASKVMDPAKLSEELAELYEAFTALQAAVGGEQEQDDASDDSPREVGDAPSGPPID